jgi:hypothetical protein
MTYLLFIFIYGCEDKNEQINIDNIVGSYCGENIRKNSWANHNTKLTKVNDNTVLIGNFANEGVDAKATFNGNKIIVNSQTYTQSAVSASHGFEYEYELTISGSGNYNPSYKSIEIDYLVNYLRKDNNQRSSSSGTIKLYKTDSSGIAGNYSSDSSKVIIQKGDSIDNYIVNINYFDQKENYEFDSIHADSKGCNLAIPNQELTGFVNKVVVEGSISRYGNRIDIYLWFPAPDRYHISYQFVFSAYKDK